MEKVVYLLGTAHEYQGGKPQQNATPPTKEELDQFKKYVVQLCGNLSIQAIGEELRKKNLVNGRLKSTLSEVCNGNNIKHKYCDPDDEWQEKEGIKSFLSQKKKESSAEFDSRCFEEFKKREPYWLLKIQELNVFPMLFVCGALHIDSFSHLLEGAGFTPKVINKCWAPV